MRILVAHCADDALLAMALLSPGPTIVAVTAIDPGEVEQLAAHWRLGHALQHWRGSGPGKAIFWKPTLKVFAVGREQFHERRSPALEAARGALSVKVGWQDTSLTVFCARSGRNTNLGDLSTGEIASIAATAPAPFVIALGGEPVVAVPELLDANEAAVRLRIVAASSAGIQPAARLFGVSGLIEPQPQDRSFALAFTPSSRLYCSRDCRIVQAIHVIGDQAQPGAQGGKTTRAASCYDVALASANSASSRTHGSDSAQSKAESARHASVPRSSPSAQAA